MRIEDLHIFQWVKPIHSLYPVQIVALRGADYAVRYGDNPEYLVTCIDKGAYYDFRLDEIELIKENKNP